jgi:hypothetical protein
MRCRRPLVPLSLLAPKRFVGVSLRLGLHNPLPRSQG